MVSAIMGQRWHTFSLFFFFLLPQSIIVRWEPPPVDEQNGIIVGYKIRYKKKGQRRGDTAPTAGNRKFYALTGKFFLIFFAHKLIFSDIACTGVIFCFYLQNLILKWRSCH